MDPAKALIGLTTAGLISLASIGTFPLTATPALATVTVPTGAPIPVVVDGPTETFSVPVDTTGVAAGMHTASLWVTYPGQSAAQLVGSGTGTSATVPVQATLDTTQLRTWGLMAATAMDDADGSVTPLTLDVRRRTVTMLNQIEARSRHRVALGARITHYSPAAGDYVSSNLSPVVYQEYTAKGWVTRARSVSTGNGLAGVILRTTPGKHTYRAVRPTGLTVWPAVSAARTVVVPQSAVG